jgi:type IV secretion system protein VirB3
MAEVREVLQTAVIHRSLTRPQLIAGCDRELFMAMTFLAVFLIVPGGFMSESLFNILFGVALFVSGSFFLSWMAKKDTSMRMVFVRFLGYKHRYPARSCVVSVARRKFGAKWA